MEISTVLGLYRLSIDQYFETQVKLPFKYLWDFGYSYIVNILHKVLEAIDFMQGKKRHINVFKR